MTIPIIPGPFSFLGELGKGIGTAFQVAENQKRELRTQAQEDRAEASRHLTNMLELYSKGVLKKLDTDSILELGNRAGIGDFLSNNVVPRPENLIAEGRTTVLGELLPQILQGKSQYQKEQLAKGEIPTAQGEQEARAAGGKARVVAETIEEGGPAARAAAGVLSTPVAQAAEEKVRDVYYDTVAGRSVDAALRPLGGDILTADLNRLSEQAWTLAESDARSQGYTLRQELTRPYIDAAISSRRREAETEKMRATARSQPDTLDDYLRLLQNNQAMIRQQISALKEPDAQTYQWARAYEGQAQKKRTPEEQRAWETAAGTAMLRSAYESVKSYETTVQRLNKELNGNRDEFNNALSASGRLPGGTVGGAVPGRPDQSLDDNSIAAYANFLRSGTGTIEQLNQALQNGSINQTDYSLILEQSGFGTGQKATEGTTR